MYGETDEYAVGRLHAGGLSPHVRGNRIVPGGHHPAPGSIPSCTGKPAVEDEAVGNGVVYPRMYGETISWSSGGSSAVGLSPHVRGNPSYAGLTGACRGSIPACTGKPRAPARQEDPGVVYPRMYGETASAGGNTDKETGLSPHVRGNHATRALIEPEMRSIPACTGKPARACRAFSMSRVYPRMYGETPPGRRGAQGQGGLSPHVRGNRAAGGSAWRGCGSIPACTGKPRRRGGVQMRQGVYPRMYGETCCRWRRRPFHCGLSPHVRGNRAGGAADFSHQGSIPACTGKPAPRSGGWCLRQVYPRMYGETYWEAGNALQVAGLSPHVRGNHPRGSGVLPDGGSIPACTGKPWTRRWCGRNRRVYPRMYGETIGTASRLGTGEGLSPHVRGNPGGYRHQPDPHGSIPACTGKPAARSRSAAAAAVYPRMYGETAAYFGRRSA